MLRVTLAAALLLTAAGCAATDTVRPPSLDDDLLSGRVLFGTPVTEKPIPIGEMFRMDDDMRAFVGENTDGSKSTPAKVKRLLSGMQAAGLFSLDYSIGATRTASETFHGRVGNCLSFTILFVTLAREAGLDAGYQIVDVPPSWSTESGFVVVTNHINANIRARGQSSYVVDFNEEDVRTGYATHSVNERYVAALYYNNKGAEALLDEDYLSSFVNFKAAIETYPALAAAWINLGIVYSRQGRNAQAEAAYIHGLELDEDNQTAMTNLAALYEKTGDVQRAELYRERVRRHQERNPYYHFFRAEKAFTEQRFAEALALVDKALRLKHDEQRFYVLQGQAFAQLGETRSAQSSFARAREYALKDGRAGLY
jgi:Flp pilus assembly protein TadD